MLRNVHFHRATKMVKHEGPSDLKGTLKPSRQDSTNLAAISDKVGRFLPLDHKGGCSKLLVFLKIF